VGGFCAVCGRQTTFNASFLYSYDAAADGRPIPNWREHLDCADCGLQNRLRGGVHLFQTLLRPDPNAAIYLTEQGTPLYDLMRTRHPNLTASEFLGPVCPLGEEFGGLRNEDLTRLTFTDESFDFVLSFDVMEHVSDDVMAFQEVFRCLKPGGRLLFAAPFTRDRDEKVVRARIGEDGAIEHLAPPEYHGNAADPERGSLCFRYFAWDVLEDLRRAGFENCRAVHYWSRDFAYLGGEQFVFIADKPRKQHALH
jgi:SAM-dependent methyltransferase